MYRALSQPLGEIAVSGTNLVGETDHKSASTLINYHCGPYDGGSGHLGVRLPQKGGQVVQASLRGGGFRLRAKNSRAGQRSEEGQGSAVGRW